jgi:hypothetical protein
MTDFFESLAARARGEGPEVRPRLPGLFEPTPHDPSALTTVSEFIDSPPAPAAPPAPIASPEPQNQPRRNTPETPVAVSVEQPAPVATTATTVATDREPAQAPSRPPVISARLPLEPPNAQRPAQAGPPIQTLAATVPRHHDDQPQDATNRPDPLPRAIADPDTTRVRRAVEAVAPPPALGPQPLLRPSTADLVLPEAWRVRPPQSAPLQPERPQETTIHVSIGRIEVRAVQPAQEAKPREPAKPAVMSLDEYLRSRRSRR